MATGRPPLPPSFNTSIRLTPLSLVIVDNGATLQSQLTGKAISRAAWLRFLIDETLGVNKPSDLLTSETLNTHLPATRIEAGLETKITIKLEEKHRIQLRQYECYAQSLDWFEEIYRNEALLLLVSTHGTQINKMLAKKKADLQASLTQNEIV